ncbi:disulfide bond formation protein B [Rubritepida flocculans]|jgi:disulfide bond formation protein DsbB|uniref:disulfide bond formation protein B n=1 Tax=Rubritepida flocculans TaxID=182403 RepID=UPI0003F62D0F|nr:disulfide bond formation protein B [Rubritepida flocculans]
MRSALAIAALAAAAPLLARGTESWLGLVPCELCLWQRWPYWAAAGLALLAAFVLRRPWMLALAGGAVLASGAIAAFHLGVEAGWWPSPLPGCAAVSAGTGASVEDLLAALRPAPAKPCDEPAFLIPGLPLSMAGLNLIYALALGVFALGLARRSRTA